MHIFIKAAASAGAIGLAAFGAVAGSGGAALAAPDPTYSVVTGCSSGTGSPITVGFESACAAIGGTVSNPTQIVIEVGSNNLDTLLSDQVGQGLDASWTLDCTVDGAVVTVPGSYSITSTTQTPYYVIDLQSAVGSPEPTQCSVDGLTVTTALALNAADVTNLGSFETGVAAIAGTAVPGAVYQQAGSTSGGAHAALCADDTANANAGSTIQGFQCLSDLADSFVQTSAGQLVHNGDCVGVSGTSVVLAKCIADRDSQEWSQATAGGEIKLVSSGQCLTASSPASGVHLTVSNCTDEAGQRWREPAQTAALSTSLPAIMRRQFSQSLRK